MTDSHSLNPEDLPESLQEKRTPSEGESNAVLLSNITQDTHLITPVILIGASALIPVPFLDDIAKSFLEKYLFKLLAQREGIELTKEETDHLTHTPKKGCCALGCLGSAFLYPLKKILRKLFFFLEVKRSVDQATTALAQAWLFQISLKSGLWGPGQDIKTSDDVRKAIAKACKSQGVKPLEAAVSHAFRGAKGTLSDLAFKFTKKDGANEQEMAKTVDSVESEGKEAIAGLTQKLSDSLAQMSDSHFDGLIVAYRQALEEERSAPSEEGLA